MKIEEHIEAEIKRQTEDQDGMFSYEPLTPTGIEQLRESYTRIALTAKEERDRERDQQYLETNIPALIERMKLDAGEYGQYHDPDCPQMSEWADSTSECDCETIKVMTSFAQEWMGKVNEWWVRHASEHRKLCTPEGNKALTRIMGKKNRLTPTTSKTDVLPASE